VTMLQVGHTLDDMTATRPPISAPPQWTPSYGPPARQGAGGRLATLLVGLVALAALVVGIISLAQSGSSTPSAASAVPPTPIAPPAPAFSAGETAAAKEKVCTTFHQAADAVHVATSAPNGAEPIAASVNARAALVGGALALTRSVSDATPPDVANAANALADAYTNYVLVAYADGAQGPSDQVPVQNASATLRGLCG
jgi:hypothetical protein